STGFNPTAYIQLCKPMYLSTALLTRFISPIAYYRTNMLASNSGATDLQMRSRHSDVGFCCNNPPTVIAATTRPEPIPHPVPNGASTNQSIPAASTTISHIGQVGRRVS